MWRLLLITWLSCLGMPLLLAEAAPKHPAKPMLWKIEGPQLKQASYLFGTIHVSDPEVCALHPAAEQAFAAATTVHTEISLDPAGQLAAARLFIRQDGNTLSGSLGPELTERLDRQLAKINPLLKTAGLDQMKTWFIPISLYASKEQLEQKIPLDLQLWQRAGRAGKTTKGMESAAEQLGKLDQFTEAEQVLMAKATIQGFEEMVEDGVDPLQQMKQAYLDGDDAAVLKYLSDELQNDELPQALRAKFKRLLLTERNQTMAQAILKQLDEAPETSHFFAAGSLHYLGKDSVNDILTKKGYTITRITE